MDYFRDLAECLERIPRLSGVEDPPAVQAIKDAQEDPEVRDLVGRYQGDLDSAFRKLKTGEELSGDEPFAVLEVWEGLTRTATRIAEERGIPSDRVGWALWRGVTV